MSNLRHLLSSFQRGGGGGQGRGNLRNPLSLIQQGMSNFCQLWSSIRRGWDMAKFYYL